MTSRDIPSTARPANLFGAFVLSVVLLATVPSLAQAQPSYIQPNDGGPALAKPRAFHWTGYGAGGSAYGVHWRSWGRPTAFGRARVNVCVTMGAGCRRNVPVRITASGRRDLSFSGTHEYVYCRLIFRGRLDPQNPGHQLEMELPIPNACRQT
jgi:hypothetical protein